MERLAHQSILERFPEFEKLKEQLKFQCKNKNVYFFANPGNWGDALIRSGGVKFLKDCEIKYRELYRKPTTWIIPFLRGGVMIYGGSGAWCKYYNTGEKYSRLFSKRFKVIVLPSTYEKTFQIRNTVFYTRDRFQSLANMPRAEFCHDMAFYLHPVQTSISVTREGYFFRLDAERDKRHTLPKNNKDISKQGNQLSDCEKFFEEVDRYSIIHTDRLHVGIAGCLLNKEVHIYTNSYFKTRAIYDSSIKNNYENCRFHSEPFQIK